PTPQGGLGAGIPAGGGAPLARGECAAAGRAVTRGLPGLRLAGAPERRPEFVIRGLRKLLVIS
ncbi:MAG: cytochrome P450, partial [Kibdelosporangium sp.]